MDGSVVDRVLLFVALFCTTVENPSFWVNSFLTRVPRMKTMKMRTPCIEFSKMNIYQAIVEPVRLAMKLVAQVNPI